MAEMDYQKDSIILFDRQIREGKFQGRSSLSTYFVGIARWRWWTNRRKFGNYEALKVEHFEEAIGDIEASVIENEKRATIDEILSKIGARCKELLRLYKLSYQMEEIAVRLGLSSPELAKKNVYECRKKFKAFVMEHPFYKDILNIK